MSRQRIGRKGPMHLNQGRWAMGRVILGGLFALIVSTGLFISQVGAAESGLRIMPKVSIASLGNTAHMATIDVKDFLEWLRNQLRKHFGNGGNYPPNGGSHPSNGSVPIPGTLLLFGGGFVGLIVWRARQRRR